MTKRVALGNITINSTDTKGFFISQKSDDVTNFTKPLEVHSGVGAGLHVFYRAQGIISAPTMTGSYSNNWPPAPTHADITHNWGTTGSHGTDERPLFAVRWNRPQDLAVGGKAARVFTPNNASFFSQDTTITSDDEDDEQEEDQVQLEYAEGCKVSHQSNNVIRIQNFSLGIAGDDQSFQQGNSLYYAIVVFYEHDWTGGNGL
jgi:hypothetical protein